MDSLFLSESELPVLTFPIERYRFRSDLFVSKPHFTSKKKFSLKIEYEDELLDLVKSSRFINFVTQFITSVDEDPCRILPIDIPSDIFRESTEKAFRKQPILSLDKVSTRIDYTDFLVNRLINTSTENDFELEMKKESFLLPKRSSFIICDIKESTNKLASNIIVILTQVSYDFHVRTIEKNLSSFPLAKFDMIYMDPPWSNKSVRRGSKYKTSSNEEIFSWIPIQNLLAPSGYIAIWITNKQAVEAFIRSHFEELNLKYKGEWKWVKSGVNELANHSSGKSSRRYFLDMEKSPNPKFYRL